MLRHPSTSALTTTRVSAAILADALAILTLLGTSLVIAGPFLVAGGYWTYLDNPPHIAEVYSLATVGTGGWSDIAFCGFPLGTLHSPLWYGVLAALARAGIRIDIWYGAAVWLGFIAPALAIYLVGRRALSPLPAALVAYVLLIHRSAIIGPAAALGGMWTFYLGAAGLVVLIDRIGRVERNRLDVAITASFIGLVGLTHLFAIYALAILAVVHAIRSFAGGGQRRARLKYDGVAVLLGAVAASRYWLGAWLDIHWAPSVTHNRSLYLVIGELFIGPRRVGVLDSWPRDFLKSPLMNSDAILQAALVALGICGAWIIMRRRTEDDAPIYGLGLAGILLVLLLGVLPGTTFPLLGPISWRLTYFANVGFAFGAFPLLSRVSGRWSRPRPFVAITMAIAAVTSGLLWGPRLRNKVPTPDEIHEVRQLWTWLADHRRDDWGRVYLQDMDAIHPVDNLAASGLLALSAEHSGIAQVGAFYDIVPFPVEKWTHTDRGILFGKKIDKPYKADYVIAKMSAINATHLVTSDEMTRDAIGQDPRLKEMFRIARFTVFERADRQSQWAAPITSGVHVERVAYRTGHISVLISSDRPGGEALVKVAFNPYWSLNGGAGASLAAAPNDLLVVRGIPAGQHDLDLRYRPSRWPLALSWMGWVVIAGLAASTALRRAPSRARNPAHDDRKTQVLQGYGFLG